jgi:hypothetical protein
MGNPSFHASRFDFSINRDLDPHIGRHTLLLWNGESVAEFRAPFPCESAHFRTRFVLNQLVSLAGWPSFQSNSQLDLALVNRPSSAEAPLASVS